MEPTTARVRPMGVTILAVLSAIGGVLSLLGGLGLFALGLVIFAVLLLAIGALDLAFAYGAWTLKPWAWILGIAVAGLGIALALVNYVTIAPDISSLIISIAINGVILYYLMTPPVKAAFGRA
jgi:hypothetical protein